MTPPLEHLFQSRNLIPLAVEKLGRLPIDFSEKIASIRENRLSEDAVSAAGVLLLLDLRTEPAFVLVKRSSQVAQPGDLSCPGGMLNTMLDPLLRLPTVSRLNPIITGKARSYLFKRDADSIRAITLFFATALRETWEEINLSPCKISFLGTLPTYSLRLFKRTIFPLVGFVKKEWTFRPNSEVERIVEIPLKTFFRGDHYHLIRLQAADDFLFAKKMDGEFPCLVYRDGQGHEDILWGATFNIIMNFLHVVFDFTPQSPDSSKIIYKPMYHNYPNNR
jgi:8-oxo-dGTP pyrophosphatase MutT (NUDIX family)